MFCWTSSLFLYSQDACSKIRTFQLFWVNRGNQASYWGRKKAATRKVRLLFSLIKEKNIQLYWYGHIHLHGNLKSNSYPSWILMHGILVSQKGHQFIFGHPPPPWLFVCGLNPLHLYICMHILHTVLFTFPKVLIRRIC